jgi:hypothetical protein
MGLSGYILAKCPPHMLISEWRYHTSGKKESGKGAGGRGPGALHVYFCPIVIMLFPRGGCFASISLL